MILPKGLLGTPMDSTSLAAGLPKLVWFQMLKKSGVKRKDCRSVSLKFLMSEKSQFCWCGPRKTLRPRLPKSVVQKLALGAGAVAGTLGSQSAGYKSGAEVNA